MSTIRVSVDGVQKYRALSARLKKASNGRELQRELQLRINLAGRPALMSAQRAVEAVEVQSASGGGRKSTGLRRRIAAATEIRLLPSGIRIRVVGKRVDPVYGRTLARLMNDTNGRPWVHPLFGNQEQQHTQKGREWFAPSIRAHAPQFRQAALDAMDEIADMIRG